MAAFALPTEPLSLWDITPATGKSGCRCRPRPRNSSAIDAVPFAGYCTDPCDGRTQGTPGMFDSLPYRNDAAIIFRRLIRSLPTRNAVLGFATCDKGLPAMMIALAGSGTLPCVLVPGGVTLLAEEGEDAGRVQTIGARFSHGQITLEASGRGWLPRVRIARRRMPVSRYGGDVPSGRRGSRNDPAAFSPRALRPSDLVGYGASVRPRCCSRWKPPACASETF